MGKGKRRLKSADEVLLNVDGALSSLLPALFESPVMGVALLDSQFRFRAISGALAMNGVVELTGLKNLEVSLNHMIGNLVRVSARLKTELQFLATTGQCSDGKTGLLPQAIELIDSCIRYAKGITGRSRRNFSVNVPDLQRDSDQAGRIAANKADINIRSSGKDWRRKLSRRESEVLRLLADCKSNKDIANEMNISVRTAETYRARVMMKLELPSIGHLIRFAVRNNIIKA